MSSGINIRDNRFSFSDLTANFKFVENLQIGYQPDKTNSGAHSIAIGTDTGVFNQGTFGIAIGYQTAQYNQRTNAIAIGEQAGQNSQGSNAIAIGEQAGQNQQKPFGISIGTNAGKNSQGTASVALGYSAGYTNQDVNSIAIGTLTGYNNQGQYSIAIGENAGQNNQGQYSISLGANAGKLNQPSNSIIINASGNTLNSNTSGLFLRPIRKGDNDFILFYKRSTSEVIKRINVFIRVGDLKYTSRTTDDDQWFICDGRSLSVAQYPLLFAIIGYTFGGSGANFNLPDPRSRILGAIGQGSGLSNRTSGQNVGAETHTLTIPQMPNHNHTITDPGHTHPYLGDNGERFLGADVLPSTRNTKKTSNNMPNTSSSTTGITINNTGGNQPHNIMQPTLFIGNLFVYVG